MSNFAEESNNNTDTNTISNTITNTDTIKSEGEGCEIPPLSLERVSDLAFPVPETIEACSPGATFTTYKMGGSSGISGKENQDACSVVSIKANGTKFSLTTVCDGHGLFGQTYSNTVVTMMPKLVIQKFDEVLQDPFSTLKSIFADVTTQLKSSMGHKSGGTTVTVTILSDGLLIVANVGDCDALLKTNSPTESIVIELNGQVVSSSDLISEGVIKASVDHNCNNYSEVVRVLELGAKIKYATSIRGLPEIDAFVAVPVAEKSDNDANPVINYEKVIKYEKVPHSKQLGGFISNLSKDPAVYFHGNGVLNMTRSFGDWSAFFLLAEPDVTRITWNKGDRARLLVASDGYFNCFSHEDQIKELDFDLTPSNICERGHTAVGKTFGHKHADNTTIVVLDTGL